MRVAWKKPQRVIHCSLPKIHLFGINENFKMITKIQKSCLWKTLSCPPRCPHNFPPNNRASLTFRAWPTSLCFCSVWNTVKIAISQKGLRMFDNLYKLQFWTGNRISLIDQTSEVIDSTTETWTSQTNMQTRRRRLDRPWNIQTWHIATLTTKWKLWLGISRRGS